MGAPDFSAIVSGAFKGVSLQQQAAESGGSWSFSCFLFDMYIYIYVSIHILPVYHLCISVMTA